MDVKRILIVADVQNDFCPGGILAVEKAESILPNINALIERGRFDYVIATQDWHPEDHISFAVNHDKPPFEKILTQYGEQVLLPVHCVAGTKGAELHPALSIKGIHYIIHKGFRASMDCTSGFFEDDKKMSTGLHGLITDLAGKSEFELVVTGIATEGCVYSTAKDAIRLLQYWKVFVAFDACASLTAEGEKQYLGRMRQVGIEAVPYEKFLK